MRLAPVVLVLVSLVGCGSREPAPSSGASPDPGRPCTAMACLDEGAVVLRYDAAHFRTGAHHFEITADGQTVRCDAQLTSLTETVFATCDGRAQVHVGAETRMVEVQLPGMPGVVGATAEVVEGRFHATITVYTTPASIHVVHTIDGAPHADRTASLTYAEHRPNGPGCDPVCQQGRVELEGP
ncbi:MAG: hypothetical protein J0L92_04070 [Deltaproteobacteria bacterium]|nr:hypothetical protein [Deltaproteobacteria bacterium]